MEEVKVLLHKFFNVQKQKCNPVEMQSPSSKTIQSQLQTFGADLLEIAAPEIGGIVGGRKKIKIFEKNVETKTV